MVPAATIDGRLLDEEGDPLAEQRIYLDGDVLPPSSSIVASAQTDSEGRFRFEDLTPGFERWLELPDGDDLAVPRTQTLKLDEGEDYRVVLQVATREGTGKMLRIASVNDSLGRDVLAQVIGNDPRARPYVDEAAAEKAREILDRLAEVNRYWFRGPSDKVKSFSYSFHLAGKEPRGITHQDYVDAKSWYREWYPKGISYTGGARVLASLRGRARFRDLQMDDEQIAIYFVLKHLPSTVAAGNGIAGTWSGFFNMRMHEGLIKLDAKRLTPLSVEYGKRRELYSDFVEIEEGHYVPRRIQILSPGMQFDFRFRVLQPDMWLFERSIGRSGIDEEQPVAWVTDVKINGEPAVARDRGKQRN
jgi:hypothetical protein